MGDSQINVAVIGAGRIGLLHAATIRERIPAMRVVAVSDIRAEALDAAAVAGFPAVPNWRSIISDDRVDAVVVASATERHAEQVIAAVEVGKAVFCEKPIAPTLEETDSVITAAERAGVILQVGLQRRFDPAVLDVRSAVDDGRIGTPLLLRISSRDPEPPPRRYARFAGGLYIDSAIHDFDTARFVMGEEIVEISSTGDALFDDAARQAGDVDTAATILRFASGAIGVIDNCRVSAQGFDQRIEVHGMTGTAATPNMSMLGGVIADASGVRLPPNVGFFPQRYAEAYARQFASFAACMRSGACPEATAYDARTAFVLAVLAERSRRKKAPIPVGDIRHGGPALEPSE